MNDDRAVFEAVLSAQQESKPAALATVIETQGSVPRQAGSKMLVWPDGEIVGTVGGGTGIDTQHECLAILGVAGGGDPPGAHAKAFAEIIAAGVLAGELSLLGALAAQHLARAHQDHGRG